MADVRSRHLHANTLVAHHQQSPTHGNSDLGVGYALGHIYDDKAYIALVRVLRKDMLYQQVRTGPSNVQLRARRTTILPLTPTNQVMRAHFQSVFCFPSVAQKWELFSPSPEHTTTHTGNIIVRFNLLLLFRSVTSSLVAVLMFFWFFRYALGTVCARWGE